MNDELDRPLLIPAGALFPESAVVVLAHVFEIGLAALRERGAHIDPDTLALHTRLRAMARRLATSDSGTDVREAEQAISVTGSAPAGDSRMMSAKEASAALGCSVRWVRHLAAAGELRAHKLGRAWTFDRCDLVRFMEERGGQLESAG